MSGTDTEVADDIEPNPEDLPIKEHFWEVYTDLVRLVYNTHPSERLGIIKPWLYEEYGPPGRSGAYERVENHVLRTVAFIEHFDNNFEPVDREQ